MTNTEKITALKQERTKLIEEARAAYDAAEKAGKPLDGDARAQWLGQCKKAEELSEEIEGLERLDKLERAKLAAQEHIREDADPAQRPEAEARAAKNKAFDHFLRYGLEGMPADERRDLSAGTDTAGGYMMPPEDFRAQLIKAVDNLVFMRQLSTLMTVNMGDTLGAPSITADPSAAAWTAEAGSITADSTMAIGKRQLTPSQLTKLIKISMKLLRVSSIPADGLVIDRISYLLGQALENGYQNGSGSGEPLGVFTADANGIDTDRDYATGNSTTAIAADNLIGQKFNIKQQYWGNASWIFSRTAMSQIAKLKDGDGQYLWQGSVVSGSPDRLLGFPIYMSELAPATFTTGLYVGILGDFKAGYWIADLTQMDFQRLVELYAANSQVGIIGRIWSDGAPVLSEAFSRVTLA